LGKEEAGSYHPAAPRGGLSVAKFLVDECLHTSLVELAHAAGHAADHVTYLALGGAKDWQLMDTILERDYTFVTNNRSSP
jgi:predicted nuclease of predicted toxin-antitoxin system